MRTETLDKLAAILSATPDGVFKPVTATSLGGSRKTSNWGLLQPKCEDKS
jgi:hypothetical protein